MTDFKLTKEHEDFLADLSEDERERYKKHWRGLVEILPGIKAECEKQYTDGYYRKGKWDDYWQDDGSIFRLVDSEGQGLWFRYGMVFNNTGNGDGMWIEYQKWDLNSELQGPVLMSDEAFEELIRYYRYHRRRRTWWHRLYWSIIGRRIYNWTMR